MRRVIAALIVVGLAVGVFLLWPTPLEDEEPEAVGSTTTTTVSSTTSTTAAVTTSITVGDSHVVETVEEAEEILRELWFGWFEGIYNQDEGRIRQVVATEAFLDAGIRAFGTLTFTETPTASGLHFEELEILTANEECLAVWSVTTTSFLASDPRSGVEVVRWTDDGWRLASSWRFREDLWEADCEMQL